jgi:hypothetical protein
MTREEIISLIRTELPRLLREDPSLRLELLDAIGGNTLELVAQELTRLRQDFSVRFEAIEQAQLEHSRRFEVIEQTLLEHSRRFEVIEQTLLEHSRRFEVIEQTQREHSHRFEGIEQTLVKHGKFLADLRIGLGSLGGRMGQNLEEAIRVVIEQFSGISPLTAERLILVDEAGEVFEPGAEIEFDAYVSDGRKFLVEVKSKTDPDDVRNFARKAAFAERKLGHPVEKVIITLAADPRAVVLAEQMGITYYNASAE